MIPRRTALAGLAALSVPVRPVRANRRSTLLLGVPPGSRLDALTRAIVPYLARQPGSVDFVIRNIPGEGGLTAMNALAEAPPSGATYGWVSTPSLSARMVDRGGDGLLSRLRLLGAVMREPIAFVSPASTPLESVRDVIRRAAEDADGIPLGTPSPGSPPHLAALRLQAVAQTRLTIVTFPSAAAARQAVLSGNVSAAALGLTDVIGPLRDGRLHGIGLAARNRFGMLPDMPVLEEAGLPLAAVIRRGLAAPAGLPQDLAGRLIDALRTLVLDPDFRQHADEVGFVPVWTDAKAWSRIAEAERTDLANLWRTDPWLTQSGG
jgi:tripartite-type tricarboxylate transporter receptor subunit TctC